MIVIREQSGNGAYAYVKKYTADTEAEIELLPKYPTAGYSSTCLVIETGNTYILNGKNEWVPLHLNGGGGSTPSIVDTYVSSGVIDGENHLILTLSDGAIVDCGAIPQNENEWENF